MISFDERRIPRRTHLEGLSENLEGKIPYKKDRMA
jgi:hypothetical protein